MKKQDIQDKTVTTAKRNDLQADGKASSLERMLAVLDLFTETAMVWSVERICEALGYTRSTAYRYTKELADAGLLFQVGQGRYILGVRIIQWDRQLKLSDPLVGASRLLEKELNRSREEIWLVCGLFKNQVVCIEQFGGLEREVSYSRGALRPLMKGATSKAILAFLPNRQLMQIFVSNTEEIKSSTLGNTWDEFKRSLRLIRQQGYSVTRAEVDDGAFGVAAPIFNSEGKVIASLSCVRSLDTYVEVEVEHEGRRVMELAGAISREYARLIK